MSQENVPDLLRKGAHTYEERAKVYGPNYKHFGLVMRGLFPNGLHIVSEEDWVRLGLIQNCVTKLGRYCASLKGHADSAHDLMVYAAMLEEMTAAPEPRGMERQCPNSGYVCTLDACLELGCLCPKRSA